MIESLPLTPRPLRLTETDGAFTFDHATVIQIGPGWSEETRFAAETLQTALEELTGLRLAIVPATTPRRGRAISLMLPARDGVTFASAGIEWEPPVALGAEGYTLGIDELGATIAANDEAGVFYGAQTLIQIARAQGRAWPGVRIADRPAVPHRGFLLDVTRGKVHSLEALGSLVRLFAHVKCNHLQLYTEHAFDFPSSPAIGAGTGALTPNEVMALDRLCRRHHIELAPNFQSLGHQGRLLKLPAYEHLAETPWRFTFATANDEVFALLDRLYGDLLPCFTSRLLNVNADEPWDLGRGVSKAMTAERGIGGVYLTHLRRLHELATKHGCRMAMWADVLKHHGDLIAELPDDVLLIDWWYEATEHYDSLTALAASGREFWICAATSSWLALYPRLENAIRNIHDYVEQGIAAGASGVLLSDWGDNGHDQLLSSSRYPFVWGAECAWTGATTTNKDFDAAFGLQILQDRSGALVAALRRLGAAMQVARNWMTTWNSAMALYEDPIAGKVASVSPPEVVAEARAAADALHPLLSQIRDERLGHDLGFVAFQVRFACDKVETTRAIQALLAADTPLADRRAGLGESLARLRGQRDLLPAMRAEFEQRWLASARPSSIQFNLDRYDALIAQYDHAIAWLAGVIASDDIPAPYDPGDYAVLHEATYRWVKELEAIIGHDALPEDIKEYLRDVGGG
jgi:hexosaminidase